MSPDSYKAPVFVNPTLFFSAVLSRTLNTSVCLSLALNKHLVYIHWCSETIPTISTVAMLRYHLQLPVILSEINAVHYTYTATHQLPCLCDRGRCSDAGRPLRTAGLRQGVRGLGAANESSAFQRGFVRSVPALC